jgi:hypothetical protein
MLAYLSIRAAIERGDETSTLIEARTAEKQLQADEAAAWTAWRR